MSEKKCRCLLAEADEAETLKTIKERISLLDENIKCDAEEYEKRLNICSSCENLVNGFCGKCGCYVELRAAVKNNRCPCEKRYW